MVITMKSATYWGIGFIVAGIVLGAIFRLSWVWVFYILPMIAIGIALMAFGGREKKIEKIRKKK